MGRVLVVDDEMMMRNVLSTLLKSQGHEVEVCDNGQSAIDCIKSGDRFDLLVSDIRMNPVSGIDVVEAVHGLDRDLPVILVSAYSAEKVKQKAEEFGVRKMLAKPFDMQEFIQTVKDEMRPPADS